MNRLRAWPWVWWHVTIERRWPRLHRAVRWLQGARPVETADVEGTAGAYCDDSADVTFGGACPVQGEGEVDGRECYYRSRGSGWSFEVYSAGDPDKSVVWEYGERRYFWPDGGWVSADVSRRCIERAVAKWRER